MEKHKSKVAILILMVMLITGITSVIEPTLVYGGINHNTGLGDLNDILNLLII